MATLVITSSSQAGQIIQLKEGLNKIGRHPQNDVQISDPSVSSWHCELTVSPGGNVIRDLGSTNGTAINNMPIMEGNLCNGHTLQLGQVLMKFDLADVQIAIPEFSAPGRAENSPALFFDDGTAACMNHANVVATYKCPKCSQFWCVDCVKILKITGGTPKIFCGCSGQCETLAALKPKRGKSFLGRLTQTLKLPFFKN